MDLPITIDTRRLIELELVLGKIGDPAALRTVLDRLGQAGEDAARERIEDTKTSPAGEKWDAWSQRYARTRGTQHSLLVGEQSLLESMTHTVDDDAVQWGSNLVYAKRQNAARPYLGIGDIESEAFDEIMADWFDGVTQ